MGTQGLKRKKHLKKDFVCYVDKYKNKALYKSIFQVPLKNFDAALICVPDNEKYRIIKYCLENKKHVLIEKPLILKNNNKFTELEKISKKNKVICYVAYNHRFEPGIIEIKNLLKRKVLGKVYSCKIFYGNGTARLVKLSKWRDKGKGVITDIGSHLIDMSIFWFGSNISSIKTFQINKYENKAPDHCVFQIKIRNIKIDIEMTLCMWRNSFQCDLIGSKGSAHLSSLTKWSKSSSAFRKRKLPSGYPNEKKKIYKKGDPTWEAEFRYFKKLIKNKKPISLNKELLINKVLKNI